MNVLNFVRRRGQRHYECRCCGTNLEADDNVCPECNGEPVVYEID